MTRSASLLAFAAALAACSASTLQTQATVAGAIAHAANDQQPPLDAAYRAENKACVEAAKSAQDAEACFAHVDARFQPVFDARKALAIAQGAWATEIEKGGSLTPDTITRLETAWCALVHAAPASVTLPNLLRCP
jgi:hypothetical protein